MSHVKPQRDHHMQKIGTHSMPARKPAGESAEITSRSLESVTPEREIQAARAGSSGATTSGGFGSFHPFSEEENRADPAPDKESDSDQAIANQNRE